MIGTALVVGVLALYAYVWVRTFVDIRQSPLDANGKLIWTLLILVAQFLGPMAWWWAGPGARHRQSA